MPKTVDDTWSTCMELKHFVQSNHMLKLVQVYKASKQTYVNKETQNQEL